MFVLWLAACSGPVVFEKQCEALWPADVCASRNCTRDPVSADYADAFLESFQESAGWSDDQMEAHVTLREVDDRGNNRHLVTATVEIDWVEMLITEDVRASGSPPTFDDILPVLREQIRVPTLDPDANLAIGEGRVHREIRRCEQQEGVSLGLAGWCDPTVTEDGSIAFGFSGGGAGLTVDVGTGEVDCHGSQVIHD